MLFCTDDGSLGSLAIDQPSLVPRQNDNTLTAASQPDDDSIMDDVRTLPESRQSKPVPADVVYQEQHASFLTFDTEAADSRDVFCATDQDCLVYIHRGQAHS